MRDFYAQKIVIPEIVSGVCVNFVNFEKDSSDCSVFSLILFLIKWETRQTNPEIYILWE